VTSWLPICWNRKLLLQSPDTVGYFIPVRRKRNEAERAALKEASARWQEVLVSKGISEEEAVTDLKICELREKGDRAFTS
jgi:hypothetical protein